MPPVEVALNRDGTRWVAEVRGLPETRAYGRTVAAAAAQARRNAQETGRFKSSSRTEVA
jgi:hypothetical protein